MFVPYGIEQLLIIRLVMTVGRVMSTGVLGAAVVYAMRNNRFFRRNKTMKQLRKSSRKLMKRFR